MRKKQTVSEGHILQCQKQCTVLGIDVFEEFKNQYFKMTIQIIFLLKIEKTFSLHDYIFICVP